MLRRSECPLCRSSRGEPLFTIDYDSDQVLDFLDNFYGDRRGHENRVEVEYLKGEELVIRHCSDCDFYWHEYILDDEGMESLYEEWVGTEYSRQKRNDWGQRHANVSKASYLRSYFEGLKQPEDLRVLDFGMGWGGYLQAVRAWGCEVHGVEISDVRREKARAEGVTVYKNIAEVDGEFDVVASHQTFEHIPDPSETVASLRKLVADNGVMHISTPIATRPVSTKTVLTKGPFQPLEHINGFTRDSMIAMMDNHNLTPLSINKSSVRNPRGGGVRDWAKLGLHVTNTYWLAYRVIRNGFPKFFTPDGSDN